MLGTCSWLVSLSTTTFPRMLVSQRTCRMRFMSVHQAEGKVSQKSSCVGPKTPKPPADIACPHCQLRPREEADWGMGLM